jgi:hypothetical protein
MGTPLFCTLLTVRVTILFQPVLLELPSFLPALIAQRRT